VNDKGLVSSKQLPLRLRSKENAYVLAYVRREKTKRHLSLNYAGSRLPYVICSPFLQQIWYQLFKDHRKSDLSMSRHCQHCVIGTVELTSPVHRRARAKSYTTMSSPSLRNTMYSKGFASTLSASSASIVLLAFLLKFHVTAASIDYRHCKSYLVQRYKKDL
jgi:hypothetical protein